MTRDNDNEVFDLFEEPKRQTGISSQVLVDPKNTEAAKLIQASPGRYVFMLERTIFMDHVSVLTAIRSLLDANAPASTWLLFTCHLYGSEPQTVTLRDRIWESVRGSKAQTPSEQLAFARIYERYGTKDEAKAALFLAWRLRKLTANPESDSTYERIAKNLDVLDEMKALPQPTPEFCEAFGFACVTPEMCPWETEVEPDKDVCFIVMNKDDDAVICIVKVVPQGKAFSLNFFTTTLQGHGASRHGSASSMTSSSSGARFGFIAGKGHFHVGLTPGQTPYTGGPVRLQFQKDLR
jgi:hypothetical protein